MFDPRRLHPYLLASGVTRFLASLFSTKSGSWNPNSNTAGTKMMANPEKLIRVFMVGDVMLGRGIDMILPHHCDPKLYEGYVTDARDYVKLSVDQSGALPTERGMRYVWGDALEILEEKKPDIRLINLETSITTSETPWLGKGINYRMHPGNVETLKEAKIDCCVLSNNHVLDWGYPGLEETLSTLRSANITYVGAGKDISEAQQPAVFDLPNKGRVLIFAGGHRSSGVFDEWQARKGKSGVNILNIDQLSHTVHELSQQVKKAKKPGDIVILSIHWGGNWGFKVPDMFQRFAHSAIDSAGVDVIHGHSSHHVKGVEVYKGKLIIYGCGDFLNDYEGIFHPDHVPYRSELSLMYLVDLDPETGDLVNLLMVPTMTKKMCVRRAEEEGVKWLHETMHMECKKLGGGVKRTGNELHLLLHDDDK
ncbi:uncharacterized protein LOC106164428 [Lingula anatina]|uniref:Uncharacterized protein LOC106164428 n=1 Tax=Lingula anatina TaxID=7574 RepID=A0A1S3IIR8_LINAN|nr:uncharacterized protein LOC106164428 [Lingula anatina]|eukprot:XP_013397781.1 uncharacterized protein LOC106164428 [Lingula anatina]